MWRWWCVCIYCLFFCGEVLARERPLALFLSSAGKGHMEPLLQLAKELMQRDVDVLFSTLLLNNETEAKEYVETYAVPFLDIGSVEVPVLDTSTNKTFWEALNQRSVLEKTITEVNKNIFLRMDAILSKAPNRLLDLPKKPSVIIYEFFSIFAGDLAYKHSIPGVLVSPSMSYTYFSNHFHSLAPSYFVGPQADSLSFTQRWFRYVMSYLQPVIAIPFYWKLGTAQTEVGLSRTNLFNLDYRVSRYQHLYLQTTTLPLDIATHQNPMIQSVGPMIHSNSNQKVDENLPAELKDVLEESKQRGEKVIYVTFGSMWEPSVHVTSAILNAIARMKDTRAIWARGTVLMKKYGIELNEEQKRKIFLGNYIPQKAVLSHEVVKVVVSHCGMGGMGESVFYEKPILGIPLAADQFHIAARILDAGVGLTIESPTVTEDEIKEKLERLMSEKRFAHDVRKMKTLYRLAGGVERAADLVEFSINFGNPDFLVPFYDKLPWWQESNLDTTFASGGVLLILWFLCKLCCCKSKTQNRQTKTKQS